MIDRITKRDFAEKLKNPVEYEFKKEFEAVHEYLHKIGWELSIDREDINGLRFKMMITRSKNSLSSSHVGRYLCGWVHLNSVVCTKYDVVFQLKTNENNLCGLLIVS